MLVHAEFALRESTFISVFAAPVFVELLLNLALPLPFTESRPQVDGKHPPSLILGQA